MSNLIDRNFEVVLKRCSTSCVALYNVKSACKQQNMEIDCSSCIRSSTWKSPSKCTCLWWVLKSSRVGDGRSYRGYIAILFDHGPHFLKRSAVKHRGAITESTGEESYCTAAGGDTPTAPPEHSLRFPLCQDPHRRFGTSHKVDNGQPEVM